MTHYRMLLLLPLLLLVVAASTSASAESLPAFRLPGTVRPSHYDLYVETFLGDDDEGFKFQGHVEITLAVTEAVKEIRLHAKELAIDESSVRLTAEEEEGAAPAVVGVHLEPELDFLVVELKRPLEAGTSYRLRAHFSAPLGKGLAGFYRSSYEERATGETRWLAVTQFESTDARRAFPCFDEPAFKATYSVTIAHHDKYSALSNMPVEHSQPMSGRRDWRVTRFARSLPMSTYLVAMLVSQLHHVAADTPANGTAFRVWARPEALEQAHYAADVGPRVLAFYERFFRVPYPLPKQDMVAIPDFASGAMENWGLITYRERLLLVAEGTSSAAARRDVASVVAHELAHQWFGNLVTMRWWRDLWLNEGFATYVATLGVHSVHPEWNSLDSDALSNLLTVLKFDALETSHPLSVDLSHPNEIPQIFDTISYKKGSFLIRMMSHFLGEHVFRQGLTNYLRKHELANAEQDDLWQALTEEARQQGAMPADLTVKAVMDTWTLQTGYPLLTVSRDYARHQITVTQARYQSYQVSDARRAADASCWEVPVTLTTGAAPHQVHRAWLHCGGDGRPQTLMLQIPPEAGEDDWLLLNANATGLFRVVYDARGWDLLVSALKQSGPGDWPVGTLGRAQLIADALGLAWSGDLPYARALPLLGYLQHEAEHLPWKTAFSGLTPLYRLLRRSANFGPFRELVLGLLAAPLQTWGDLRRPLPEHDLEGSRQRSLVVSWACRLGEPRCVRQAVRIFDEWTRQQEPDQQSPVPHGLEYEVVCTALRHGGEPQWAFAWQRYLASNIASLRLDLLQALACTREPWLLQRLLEWSIQEGSGIRRQDSATVFISVSNNEHGFHIAKDFLFRNIAQLRKFYGPRAGRLARYVKAIAEDIATDQEAAEFDDFAEKNAEHLRAATLAVKQARDKMSVNAAWMRAHYEELVEQLHLQRATASP